MDATNPCYIATLADDLQRHVMVFLEGADCCRAGGAIGGGAPCRTSAGGTSKRSWILRKPLGCQRRAELARRRSL